ncbi:hypothetical protein FQH33_24255, partial [Escherichia coli]|nr:hypothetical protein [Escherichia coli]EFC6822652.1 hypothetical protein [Escherichia coli]EFE8603613.1 hypothetical protein [Escherichia coli]EFN4369245.1 hypothetical protein [Escherichia coli]
PKTSIICSPMTSLKTSIKTITYLSDTGCLEIQGASLIVYKGNAIIVLSWRVKKRAYLNDKRAAVQALSGYSIPVVTVKVRVCCGAT